MAPMPAPEMRIGSRIMFTTAPRTVPTMDSVDMPSQRTRLEGIKLSTIMGALITSTI